MSAGETESGAGEPAKALDEALFSAVQALAMPGDEALARKADAVHRADRLVLDFDETYTEFIENLTELPTDRQLQSLQALDTALSSLATAANAELRTENAVRHHTCWAEIRDLAGRVLLEFGKIASH